jgi:cell division protease FtsH
MLVAAVYLLLVQEEPIVPLVTIAHDIREGEVERVEIEDGMLEVLYEDGRTVRAQKEPESTLVEQLTALGVTQEDMLETEIVLSEPAAWKRLTDVFTLFIQLLLIGGLAFILFTKAPSLVDSSPFGGSKGKSAIENNPTVTFNDVAGVDEAKTELQEVVSFLKEPERFVDIGARTPKGILLVGPPGTGKTLLAKAVAGESNVPFFNISGSEFTEMFVGVGASRVRKLFAQAKKHSPSIIFIDEIDAVGRRRDSAAFSNNGEREQTLNQILVEIDGFDTETGVIVIAATNRVDVLDSALLRPGRFDRQVTLSPPDIRGREETFKVHLKGKPVDEAVSARDLARATPGFVGADIENVVNEAAILAVRNGRVVIGMAEFDAAIERIMAGPEKRGRVISDHERMVVAYHETGHALVAHVSERCDPVKKVSLIPRGAAAGYTITMPEEDRYLVSCGKLKDDMAFILGGRAAEELIFDEVTTGASNDLMKATEIARRMVTEYGMSPNVGPLSYCQPAESPMAKNYSEAKAMQIDEEIKCLVEASYERAKEVLLQYRSVLDAIVEVLLVEETLSAEEFGAIFDEAMNRFPVVA